MAKNTKKSQARFRPHDDKKIEGPSIEGKEGMETRGSVKRGKGKRGFATGNNIAGPRYRGTNDVRWYASNDQLLRDVAKISFANPAGANIPLAISDGKFKNTAADLVERFPGIMTIECIPTYGISDGPQSPLNQGAQLLYNTIRAENSGARNYDAPDLMHYIMGVDSLFIFYAQLLRLYGTINHFTFLNRYSPRALVHAMGYDYDDIANNMAQLRYYINTFAKRMSTFIMPHNITVVERHFNMFGRVYKDSESPKAQFYMYVPSVVWRYNAVGSTTGAALQPLSMRKPAGMSSTDPGATFADIMRVGDDLLSYMNDEDTLTMAGDMLKAFGDANIWKQEYIDYDFQLDPVFDFTWLTQVQNLNSLDTVIAHNTFGTVVTCPYVMNEVIPTAPQSPYLQAECKLQQTRPKLSYSKLLLSPYDNPSEYDVMESSRLTLHAQNVWNSSASKWDCTILSCGAEIVNSVHIYNFINTVNGVVIKNTPIILNGVDADNANTNNMTALRNFAILDAFAMHPTKYFMTYVGGTTPTALTDYEIELPMCDIDNWAILNDATIDALHKVALLSMLYVRNVGFYAKY